MESNRKRVQPDYADYQKIDSLLKLHLVMRPGGGWAYNGGWDDHKIAEIVGVTAAGVAGFRKRNYGIVRTGLLKPLPGQKDDRLARIEAKLDALHAKMDRLLRGKGLTERSPQGALELVASPAAGGDQ
jgi:hypothetical protein